MGGFFTNWGSGTWHGQTITVEPPRVTAPPTLEALLERANAGVQMGTTRDIFVDVEQLAPGYSITPMGPQHEDELESLAKAKGARVIRGGLSDKILMLDLDTPEGPKYNTIIAFLDLHGYLGSMEPLTTKSPGGNTHRYIRLSKPIPMMAKLLLQACLSSDPMREVIGFHRWDARPFGQQESPNAMFETPEEYEKVMKWMKAEDEV